MRLSGGPWTEVHVYVRRSLRDRATEDHEPSLRCGVATHDGRRGLQSTVKAGGDLLGEGTMRFGTFHLIGAREMQPGEQRIGETVDQIVLAEQLGLHQAWIAEHHFSNYGYATNPLLIIAKAAA